MPGRGGPPQQGASGPTGLREAGLFWTRRLLSQPRRDRRRRRQAGPLWRRRIGGHHRGALPCERQWQPSDGRGCRGMGPPCPLAAGLGARGLGTQTPHRDQAPVCALSGQAAAKGARACRQCRRPVVPAWSRWTVHPPPAAAAAAAATRSGRRQRGCFRCRGRCRRGRGGGGGGGGGRGRRCWRRRPMAQ